MLKEEVLEELLKGNMPKQIRLSSFWQKLLAEEAIRD